MPRQRTPKFVAMLNTEKIDSAGSRWRITEHFDSIRAARKWAEESSASYCEVRDRQGRIVAVHIRSAEIGWYPGAVPLTPR